MIMALNQILLTYLLT